jgi:RimJ/RimL family protein N-acetyltransferase
MASLPDRVLSQLAAVGTHEHVAWVATIDGEPVGIGRYAAADGRTVDLAFEVVDDLHGQGLGGALLDTVATVACFRGFTAVTATVHPGNHASVRLLRQVGLALHVSDGLLEGVAPLRLPDPPRVHRRAVLDLVAGTTRDRGLNRPCAGEVRSPQ